MKVKGFEPRGFKSLYCIFFGGDEGDQSPYLLNAIQALFRPGRKKLSRLKLPE